jgi:hypothetical protein
VTDNWKANAYYTYSQQTLDVAHSTGYVAALEDRNQTAGLGFSGALTPKLRVGADVLWIFDRNIYAQSLDSAASAANVAFLAQSGGLPDVIFRDTRVKLHGIYALAKNADLRLDLIHDRQRLNEWTWGLNGTPFVYSDNTTVILKPDQKVTFVSLLYSYRWR